MTKPEKLADYLKDNYKLAVGEMTLEETRQQLSCLSKEKVILRGRSYETGRKKTVHVPIVHLLKV